MKSASPMSLEASQDNDRIPGYAARNIAVRLITRVVDDGRNLDALCDSANGLAEFLKLNRRDQALARAIAVTALRNRNHIINAMHTVMDRPPPKKARFLIHSLHAALAQILFMDVPDSAAVNLCVSQIATDKRTKRSEKRPPGRSVLT